VPICNRDDTLEWHLAESLGRRADPSGGLTNRTRPTFLACGYREWRAILGAQQAFPTSLIVWSASGGAVSCVGMIFDIKTR
jgi:hypothetical protein